MNHRTLSVVAASAAFCISLPAQWHQVTTATNPGPRGGEGGCRMTFEPNLQRCILYGGSDGLGNYPDDTWAWNGTTWTQLATAGPGGRSGHVMVWENWLGNVVLYGGAQDGWGGPNVFNDTWLFDISTNTWSNANAIGGAPALDLHAGCFVPGIGQFGAGLFLVTCGVRDAFYTDNNETWGYNPQGNRWTLVTAATATGPRDRHRPAMCYMGAPNYKAVLFGGYDFWQGQANDDTWVFDAFTMTWSIAPVAGARPPRRWGASLAYDSVRHVAILTGGADPVTGSMRTDTWEWNGTGWRQLTAGPSGYANMGAAVEYLANVRQVALYGGHDSSNMPIGNGATWQFGAFAQSYGSGCPGSAGTPTLTANGAPRIGSSYVLSVANAPAGAIGFLIFDFQNATSSLGNLPQNLAFAGLGAACSLLVGDTGKLLLPSTGANAWTLGNIPSYAFGLPLFTQVAVLDVAAPGSMTTTNAVRAAIGY